MVSRLVIGAVVILAAVFGSVVMIGGDARFILDPGFFLLVALAPLGTLLAGPGLRAARAALQTAFRPDLRERGGEARASRAIARLLIVATVAAGFLGLIMDVCWMLKDLTDKDAVPRTLGYGLVPLIYALVAVGALYLPLGYRLEAATLGEGALESPSRTAEPRAKRSRAIVPILAVIAFLVPAVVLHEVFWRSSFALYVDFASFSLVLFVPLGMAISGPGLTGLRRAVSAARDADATIAELREAEAVARFLARSLTIAVALGQLVGTAYLLAELDNKHRVGPCVALMLISAFWGLVGLTAFALPLRAAAARRLELGPPARRD